MKKIIIIRHGSYDHDENLSDSGRFQMLRIVSELSNGILLGHTAIILSSSAPRAQQSAQILAEKLDIRMETHEILWSDNRHDWNIANAFDLIKEKQKEFNASIIIVVTHLEYCDYLPAFIYNAITKQKKSFDGLQKGQKLIIDFEEVIQEELKTIENTEDGDELPF